MTPKSRTLLGIALFIPLAAFLLATFACLPAPVGDPATSKVDPTLNGAYKITSNGGGTNESVGLALLHPWDDHTYLLQYMEVKKDDKEYRQLMVFKAWLTEIGGQKFLTCQPMDDLKETVGDEGAKAYWAVLRLDKTDAGMEARMVSPDSELVKGLTKREELEAVIKAHVSDKALYSGDPLVCKKLGKEDKQFIEDTLSKFSNK